MSTENSTCDNCGAKLEAEAEYCHLCGQKNLTNDIHMKEFLSQFMSDYFTFDSKFFKSILPLLFKPGFLTDEFFAGRRVRYIPPLRLYIFISIVFFLILSFWGDNSLDEAVDRLINVYFPRLFFILLPVFAGILQLLYIKRVRNFARHFLFSVHYHAFLFLAGIVYLLISEVLGDMHLIIVNQILALLFTLAYLVYLFAAMRKVYGQSIGSTFLKFLALLVIYGVILSVVSLVTLLLIS